MKRKFLAITMVAAVLLTGCQADQHAESSENIENAEESFSVEQMNQKMLDKAGSLPKSNSLYFENGLEITGLGVTYDGRPSAFDGCY